MTIKTALKYLFASVLFLVLGELPSSSAWSQGSVPMVQIYQNFLASQEAAQKCNQIDPKTEPKFLANAIDVTTRATNILRAAHPEMSDPAFVSWMDKVAMGVRAKVDVEIASNGCASPRIIQLLTLYKMHSEIDLYHAPKRSP